jgi:RNA polymerase sigma factor (sigma-70 family)
MPGLDRLRHHVCTLTADPDPAGPTDVQLLERFVRRNDQLAFAALVRRHGPMVLGVCRRVLRDAHEAEDAFQATFLVLARKSASLRKPEALAGWLYGVAYRTAVKARDRSARWRQAQEEFAEPADEAGGSLEVLAWRELQAVLDEEIQRLPARYRGPVVLCCLEGQTYQEAGRRLGCPAGTVAGRLSRARERLRGRLARRGLTLSAGLFAGLFSARTASAAVPGELITSTAQAAAWFATGKGPAALSGPVVALAKGVLQAMLWSKLKVVLGACLLMGAVGLACAVFAYHSPAAEGDGSSPLAGGTLPDAGASDKGGTTPTKKRGDPVKRPAYPEDPDAGSGTDPYGEARPALPIVAGLRLAEAQDQVDLCKARLQGKQAELEEAKILHEKARKHAATIQKLSDTRAITPQEAEEARFDEKVRATRVVVKEAEVKEATILLRQAERRLKALGKKPEGSGKDAGMGEPMGGAPRPGVPTGAAKKAYEAVFAAFQAGRKADAEKCYLWSKRWRDAERAAGNRKAQAEHAKRMRALRDLVLAQYRAGQVGRDEVAAAEYYWQEARAGSGSR